MTRQEKIDFLVKQLSDRLTEKRLENKSDQFINALVMIEGNREY